MVVMQVVLAVVMMVLVTLIVEVMLPLLEEEMVVTDARGGDNVVEVHCRMLFSDES